jgi:hypothetical protein
MKRVGRSSRVSRVQWTYVLIGALGMMAIILMAGLLYSGYQALVSRTSTPSEAAMADSTAPKPWPTVITATPTVTPTPTPRSTNTPAPTPTATATPILIDFEELGKLVTIQYKLQTISVVEEKEDNWIERLFGENRVALVATGEVMAGVDVTLLGDEDIVVEGTTVRLVMPPAEIVSVRLIPGESWVYDRTLNILKPNWQLELQAHQQAETELAQWSTAHGILEQAEEVFTSRIETFLRRLGFVDVTILFRGSEERH